jgi:hypothetical protein
MITTKTTMKLEHFHDFYYLEALSAELATNTTAERRFNHSVERLIRDVSETLESISENIAFRSFVYLYAACLGEARHARSSNAKDTFVPVTLKLSRDTCYETISNYRPTKRNLHTLVEVFNQEWDSGFGGEAWLKIAEALRYYFKVSPAAFIDHVIDLEHNNGTAFNKSDARRTLYFDTDYDGNFKYFLDYKFSRNILEVGPQIYGKLIISRKVYRLIERFCTIFHKQMPEWLAPKLETLTPYEVEWKDNELRLETKWYRGVDVHKGNQPTVEVLTQIVGLDAIHAPEYTLKKFTAKVKKMKAEANKIAKPYMTKVLRQELDKAVAKLLEWGKTNCSAEKCKVTYPVLPCKVQKTPTGNKLLFPVPFQGLGAATLEGFEVPITGIPDYAIASGDGFIENTYDGVKVHVDGYKFPAPKLLEAILD